MSYFDERAATVAERFFDRMLVHIEGPMAGRPFMLEPWQRAIVREVFGRKRGDGLRQYRKLYLEVPRGNGKMLCMNTAIPTPTGWTTIGEIKVGDQVFAPDGSICMVTAVSDVDPRPISYLLTFSNGEQIKACADHQWVTTARVDSTGIKGTGQRRNIRRWKEPTRQERGQYIVVGLYGRQVYVGKIGDPGVEEKARALMAQDLIDHPVGVDYLTRIRTTQEIYETQVYGKRKDRNHSLRMPEPLQLPERDLPVDPYVLGAWLGDGTTAAAQLTVGQADVEEMTEILRSTGISVEATRQRTAFRLTLGTLRGKERETCRRGHGAPDWNGVRCKACERMTDHARRRGLPLPGYEIEPLRVTLRNLGVLNNKHIPAEYLRASFGQRLALLQGLMDTDGTVNAKGDMFEFTTTCEPLAHGMGELLATMGIKFSMRCKPATLNGRVVGEKWRIQFCAFRDEVPVFRLRRKLERMRSRSELERAPIAKTVQIVSVEPCEPTPMRCIEVDHPSHEYLCGRTMLPTHNSTFAAGLALYLLAVDGEQSAKVYSAAADRAQAGIVFETAEKMVAASPYLSRHIKAYRNKTMEYAGSGSKYIVLSSDAYTKHGLNPSGIVFDELHAQPNRELYDVLNTAMGKRSQPLMIMITTAGFDRNSICWEQHEYARRVAAGDIDDPTYLAAIFAAEGEDDWTQPATWRKANPNYGVSVREEFLAQECRVAMESPAYQNTFRRLYLNQWTQQENRWIDMGAWDACGRGLPDLTGRACYAGLDLASTTDIAALVLAFPPDGERGREGEGEPVWLLPFFWIPQENMVERERRDRVPYSTWVRQGLVTATPGNVIDYAYIRQQINDLAAVYRIQEIAFDPWNATQLSTELQGDGLLMVEMRQGFASLSAPSKEMLRLVLAGGLAHGANPVLRWMADNVSAKQDPAGNVKPDKSKSTGRIDGIVASVMAIGRASVGAGPAVSIYEERGVREL